MQPDVPFALLASVQLLCAAVALGVAGGVALRVGRARLLSLVIVGAVSSAGMDAVFGATLGDLEPAWRLGLRGVGVALLAVTLLIPEVRRSRPALLVLGLLGLAAGAALAPAASRSASAFEVMLAVRGVGSVLLGAWLIDVARRSLLAKVVGAIVVGVLVTALGAVGVVGSVVASSFGQQQAEQLKTVASGERIDLATLAQQASQLAQIVARGGSQRDQFARSVSAFQTGRGYAVEVSASRHARALGGLNVLDNAALLELAADPAVVASLSGQPFQGFVVLRGQSSSLSAVGIAAPPPPLGEPHARPPYVIVYGYLVDAARLTASRGRTSFDSTVLSVPDAAVVSSSLSGERAKALAARARADTIARQLTDEHAVLTQLSSGSSPAVGYAVLQSGPDRVAILAVSQAADVVLRTQRLVLTGLFVALAVVAGLAALAAAGLGRRVVNPVRRLTAAAAAVREGDLTATAGVAGADEVGELSRTFDAMTSSLVGATEELRSTAERETTTRLRLQTVLDSMSDGLVVTDANAVVTQVNPAAAMLVGAADEVVGRPLSEVLRGVGVGGEGPLLGQLNRSGRYEGSGFLQRADGGFAPVVVSLAPLGGARGSVVVVRDTTREREVERMKTEFLSNVSHELRTPLTPIKGFAEILARKTVKPEQVAEFAGKIAESSNRMQRVVDLVVDVASLDAGRVQPRPVAVDLRAYLDGALSGWQRRHAGRAGDLRRRLAAKLPAVLIDPDWLAKALAELVDNAVKFSAVGSPITVAAELGGPGQVLLQVRDKGEGMTAEQVAALFSDFAQLDGSATRSRDGLGLGLSFVRRVGDVVGFEVQVGSTPGKGSTFTLVLPAVPSKPPSPRRAPSSTRPAARTRR